MKFVFEIMKRELKGCHIIYMPHNIICDRHHYLNWAPLHFTRGYYDYALEAVNIIVSSKNRDNEFEMLEKCRLKWQRNYALFFYKYLYNNFIK